MSSVIDNIPSEIQEEKHVVPKMNWAKIVSRDTPPNSIPTILLSLKQKTLQKNLQKKLPNNDNTEPPKPPTLKELINDREKVLIILRGLPGSGKTTFARNLCNQSTNLNIHKPEICSSDYYFEKDDGTYEYNPKDVGASHRWAQSELSAMIEDGVSYIILDNINSQSWEAKRYVEPAINNGYHVEIVQILSPWCKNLEELEKRCISNGHNVSLESIKKIAKRWHKTFTIDSIMNSTGPTHSRQPVKMINRRRVKSQTNQKRNHKTSKS